MLFIKSFFLAVGIATTPAASLAPTAIAPVFDDVEATCVFNEFDEICYSTQVDIEVGGNTVETTVSACAETASQALSEFREAVAETQE